MAVGGSGAVTFTVSNVGTSPSGAPVPQLSGPDAAEFSASSACAGGLAAGASCTITVELAPRTRGNKAATLTVSAAPGGSAGVPLSGLTQNPALLAISPEKADLGEVVAGGESAPLSFTVKNTGEMPSGSVALAIMGGDASPFTVVGTDCEGMLAPGASCTGTVRFRPTAAVASADQLVASALPGGSVAAALAGTGLRPASLTIAPAEHAFDPAPLGTSSAEVAFTVTNAGQEPSGVPALALEGALAGQFVLGSNGCTAAVPPGGTCTFGVRYAPTMRGGVSATVSATASPGGKATASLTGAGQAPAQVVIQPTSRDFGTVAVGDSSASFDFVVRNEGDLPATGLAWTPSGRTGEFAMAGGGCPATLGAGVARTLALRFSPAAAGKRSGTLSVTSSAPTAMASLTGTGVDGARLALSRASKDWGSVPVGEQSLTFIFQLTNTGGSDTSAIEVGVSGDWVLAPVNSGNPCPGKVLAPGQSCEIWVYFKPAGDPGTRSGAVTAVATTGGRVSAPLTGEALPAASIWVWNSVPGGFNLTPVGGSDTRRFTIRNATGKDLAGVSVGLEGADANQFAIVSDGCSGTVASFCDVSVQFAPKTAGIKNVRLVLKSPANGAYSALEGIVSGGLN